MIDNAVAAPLVFSFDHEHAVPPRELAHLLGGKGAGLAEMTTRLGIAVPPGFTVSLDVCRRYREDGWPAELDELLKTHVDRLGERMGRRFGDPADPLLVAVRSGAPQSMPGMLDTILNLGINDESVDGLARTANDERFAWDSYRRFIEMFATTVMGAELGPFHMTNDSDLRSTIRQVRTLQSLVEDATGRPVPQEPWQQLREAVEAVFRSWDSPRARVYRRREKLDENVGTAVNVQAMVFGNRGERSGTGVVFTRDPSTGDDGPYGDFLLRAQGEEVVAGTARTMDIRSMKDHDADVYASLLRELRRLEVHYRDMCDVEFTVEDGKLWLLQTRVGKRGVIAAVRLAVAMTDDPEIALTPAEALARADADIRARAAEEVLAHYGAASRTRAAAASGLGASPGQATGRIVTSSGEALDATDDVILVRLETSPEDIAGMSASVGILTARGGLVSHAAVVARGWGIPAVVGVAGLEITPDGVKFPDGTVREAGSVVTIDGSTGEVFDGTLERAAQTVSAHDLLPELAVLEEWARDAAL